MRVWLLASCCAALQLATPPAFAEETAPLPEPHHVRSWLEMGAGLALGTGGYWIFRRQNAVDWDNPKPLSRFDGSAWVLDNNSIGVNFLGHPFTGGFSYSLARANHQSVLGAFGYSFLTSALWELGIEYKEKVSVNDVLVTPGAGLPIGEFLYKLGLYLDSGHHDSFGWDLVRGVLGTGVALDRALDGRAPAHVWQRDRLGFSRDIWHDFRLDYGVSVVGRDDARYTWGVVGKLVTLQGYGRPGSFGRTFGAAQVSSLRVEQEVSRHGSGLLAEADTVLVGYHAQRLERDGITLKGESVTVGSSVGLDYFRSAANRYGVVERALSDPKPGLSYHAPNRREQYGALQLPGVAADFSWFRAGFALASSMRLQPSFAGVGAYAFYDWAADNLDQRSKHILHRQGYFYGWGGALHLSAAARCGVLRGGFQLLYAAYRSQDGLDRHAEQLTVDVPATGSVLRYRATLGLAPGDGDVSFGLSLGARRLHSDVAGYALTAFEADQGVYGSVRF